MAFIYDVEIKTADILLPFRLEHSALQCLSHCTYYLALWDFLVLRIDIGDVDAEILNGTSVLLQYLTSVGDDEHLAVKVILLTCNITEADGLSHTARSTEKHSSVFIESLTNLLNGSLLICPQSYHTSSS